MAIKKPAKIIEEPVVIKPVIEEDDDVVLDEARMEAEDTKGGPEKYYQATGRRKESIARVRLFTKKATDVAGDEKAIVTVNSLPYTDYFKDVNFQHVVESPLRKLKSLNRFKATVIVNGGGLSGQAGAIKHGISRALELFDSNFRKKLKKSGFLTRDSRAKERRKYGLKKARKAPQWNKR
jgi:small subunit ribosomal protein S9